VSQSIAEIPRVSESCWVEPSLWSSWRWSKDVDRTLWFRMGKGPKMKQAYWKVKSFLSDPWALKINIIDLSEIIFKKYDILSSSASGQL